MQTINIPAATREEYRLVFGIARLAAATDPLTQQAVNKVAAYQEYLWARTDQAQAQRQADADAQAAATIPPKPKSAVEKHGINSPEAQAAREARRAAKADAEAIQAAEEKRLARAEKRKVQREAKKAGVVEDAPPSG